MRKILLLTVILIGSRLGAFPIQTYDFHIPQNMPSPVVAGLGGAGVTYANDPFAAYYNPALAGEADASYFGMAFRVKQEKEDENIADTKINTVIKKSNFTGFAFNSQEKVSMGFYPLVNVTYDETEGTKREHLDYFLNTFNFSFTEKRENVSYGLTLKYLYGQCIYLKENRADSLWTREDFTEQVAHGVSSDFGILYRHTNYSVGASIYDFWNGVWWEDEGQKTLTPRITVGTQAGGGNTVFLTSMTQRLAWKSDHTYHFGLEQRGILGMVTLRTGAYSVDFRKTSEINYSFGATVRIRMVDLDIAYINNDLISDNNRYYVALRATF